MAGEEEEEEIAADSMEEWGEGPPLENGEHELGAVVAVAESTFASAQDFAFAELTNEMAEGEAAVELAHAVVARLAFVSVAVVVAKQCSLVPSMDRSPAVTSPGVAVEGNLRAGLGSYPPSAERRQIPIRTCVAVASS